VDEVVLFTRKWALLVGVASWMNIKDNVKKEKDPNATNTQT